MKIKRAVTAAAGTVISVGALIIAFVVIHTRLKQYSLLEVLRDFGNLPISSLGLAVLFTLISYFLMTYYDYLGLIYAGHKIKHSRMWFLSFISYSFSNNIGHPLVAGAIRYRLYSAWELGAFGIAKVVAFCSLSLWLGYVFLTGLMFTASPSPVPPAWHFSATPQRLLGILFLILALAYLFLPGKNPRELQLRKWTIDIPGPSLRWRQLLISTLDWTFAGSVLFVLLPGGHNIHYFSFLGFFLLAQLTGILSQVPGGLGVFESVMLILLDGALPTTSALGSLLAFRIIYYLTPLGLATILFALLEFLKQKKHVFASFRIYDKIIGPLAPQFFAVIAFLGGIVMLFSGATPAIRQRLLALHELIPVPVIEVSHFFGSIIGVMLLFLAGGLSRRLRSSYYLTILMMAGGIVVSLLKGFDYEEAVILGLMILTLVPSYRHFYRSSSLLDSPLSFNWVFSILVAVTSTVWLGYFSFKHVQYSGDMLWQFSLHGDASRFLRMLVGMVGAILFLSLMRLFQHHTRRIVPVVKPEQIIPLLRYSDYTAANLALLGDKQFYINKQQTAFIMYALVGRSWIVMGDPVGKAEAISELAWQFFENCDRQGGRILFYEVSTAYLDLYLDMGLRLYKIGESGRVDLSAYDLESHENKRRRRTIRIAEEHGYSFKIIQPEELPPYLPRLKEISDAWLEEKHAKEKGFSLGFFSEQYLAHFPVAVVVSDNDIVAFANLWTTFNQEELSIDLMRHLPGSGDSLMEYLFIKLILWGKDNGYHWFDLGIAPLSGLEDRQLSPLWHKVGSLIFHGNNVYRLQGLRQYKEKFNPVWEPVYIAAKGNLSLPETLLSLNILITGGYKKVTA